MAKDLNTSGHLSYSVQDWGRGHLNSVWDEKPENEDPLEPRLWILRGFSKKGERTGFTHLIVEAQRYLGEKLNGVRMAQKNMWGKIYFD